MKNLQKLTILLVIFAAVIVGFRYIKAAAPKTTIQNEKVVQELKANLTVNDGQTNQTFDVSQYIGKTVLETTQAVENGNLKTTGSGENSFVTGINGRVADTKKHEFWELDVNGTEAQVGAGSYVIKNNDNIAWRINTY